MLEKLGEVLRKATDKIANAIFLDKNMVDSIVKDLQRALIEADVNIVLVKKLSDKIKKEALDERMKGVEKKEHIIKLLHDELVLILGEHKQLKLQKGQNRVLFLGLYGAGKCVHSDSNIQLSDGNIMKIEALYEKYKRGFKEEELEDGKIIDISSSNLFVPSFNPKTAKIENKRATHLWKLNKGNLIEVKVDNGNDFSIKVTPEHPFFALRNGRVTKIRADELTEQDFIAMPKEMSILGKQISLHEKIKELNLFLDLNKDEVKENLLKKNKSIKEICKQLKYRANYCHLTKLLKEGIIPIELVDLRKFNYVKTKHKLAKSYITFPLTLNSELSEFLGYLFGDGHISKNSVEIVNEDKEVIERIVYLAKNLFNLEVHPKKDIRTKNLYKIILASSTLVDFLSIFNLKPGKKGKNLKIPEEILLSNAETIRMFIKAYFDCDSYPCHNKRYIELTSESNILVKQIGLLLNRFEIASTISKKLIKNIPYWRLAIKADSAETYANKIGYVIKRKQDKADSYKTIGLNQGCGNQEMIPLGKILKEIREKQGFSIGEIQENAVFSYGRYELTGFISKENLGKLINYYKTKKIGRFLEILKDIQNNFAIKEKYPSAVLNGTLPFLKKQQIIEIRNNQISLTERGVSQLQLIKNTNATEVLENLEFLSQSNVFWAPINNVKEIKNDKKVVYDLTVEDNHSFIAEGFIVHNTTTIAKLGNYYAKRGNKVALVGLDVHRPAAKEQLKQLADKNKLSVFIDMEENDALKTWKKFEPKLKEYNVVLVDTAGRHNLDKELVTEISGLNKLIKPTESILVMPADIGQAAKKQAEEFTKSLQITGVIITRMDSTAKAGGALTACAETKAPVYFIATGEKINDIEEFNPESFLSRLLGMGDLQSLIEKIKSVSDEGKQEALQKKLSEGKLSLDDVVEQVKSMSSMGGFDKIKSMIPGLGKAKIPENLLETQEGKIARWEHIVKSMTKEERENPDLLKKQTTRISRIAKGAGVHGSEIRALLKQYDMLNEMMKSGAGDIGETGMLSQKQMMKMAKKFGKKMRR